MTLTTTFALLHAAGACHGRYRRLAKSLGGTRSYGKNTPIPLSKILELNGLADAIWALFAVPQDQEAERDRLARLFACWCVCHTPLADGRVVWDLLADARSRHGVEVTERYVCGRASRADLTTARHAAGLAYRNIAGDPTAYYAACAAFSPSHPNACIGVTYASGASAYTAGPTGTGAWVAAVSAQAKQFETMLLGIES